MLISNFAQEEGKFKFGNLKVKTDKINGKVD